MLDHQKRKKVTGIIRDQRCEFEETQCVLEFRPSQNGKAIAEMRYGNFRSDQNPREVINRYEFSSVSPTLKILNEGFGDGLGLSFETKAGELSFE